MKGKVKWFSPDKGFGFLLDETGVQYYFHGNDVQDVDSPRSGSSVVFTPVNNKKGARASKITLALEPEAPAAAAVRAHDSRVHCEHCNKLMVPRLVMGPPLGAGRHWTPVPKHSICPFCAGVHTEFSPSRKERVLQTLQWTISAVVLVYVGGLLSGIFKW